MPKHSGELHRLTAAEAVNLLKSRKISPLELVEAAARRIEATDSAVNALPTLCLERARDHARRIMKEGSKVERPPAWLGGLPIAVKDLNPVAGVRTTWGSPIFADHVPARSDIMVEILEGNGAIVIGKSNTPEFGAGASTFNEVFGKTRNPWNTTKSVAGSSGGSAAAVAAGEVWLATGSDLGGSLRTPASFNAVLGLRPSPGRVPRGPVPQPFDPLFVEGPIARTAADAALFLDAMVCEHREDPLSLAPPREPFAKSLKKGRKFKRIGFSHDLGIVPVDGQVADICEKAARVFEAGGATVEHAAPDFSEAIECFQTLRAVWFANQLADHYRNRRDQLKPEVVWNIEKGLALKAEDVGRAELQRFHLYRSVIEFFQSYDLLLCPAAIVPPFDVDLRYVSEVEGHQFDNYIHWISITSAITLTSCPAASVPAGFTRDALPVGLQIVGPPRGEATVLAAALLLDDATGISDRLPIDPRMPR
jgi:amidase